GAMFMPNDALPDFSAEGSSRFVAAIGLKVDEVTATSARGHAELGEDHYTPWGVIHGGVYTSIVESAASIRASHAGSDRGEFAVGVPDATRFLRPSAGAGVDVEASALYQGRTQQLWEVIITDSGTGKQLSRGQLRLQNVPLPSA